MGMTGGGRFRLWAILLVATFCVAGAAFALLGAAAPSSASAFVAEEPECEFDCGEEDGGGGPDDDPCAVISDCIPVEPGGGGGSGGGGGGGGEPYNGVCGAYRSLWEELVYEIGQLSADADPAWRAALLGDEAEAWHELVACYEENNIILG